MQKSFKKFLTILIAVIATFLIGLIIFRVYGVPYMITSELKQIQCNGTIVSMNKDYPCFMTIEVQQQIEAVKLDVNYCEATDDFFEFISIGDSIKKQAGQLLLTVIKKDNKSKKTFDYPYATH